MVLDVEEDTYPAGSFLLWGRTLDSRTVAVQVRAKRCNDAAMRPTRHPLFRKA